jgi:hypothetical protein
VTTSRETTRVVQNRPQIVVKNVGTQGPRGSQTVELTFMVDGPLVPNTRAGRYVATESITLRPADALVTLDDATVAESVWPIKDATGTQIGTITFAAGGTVGVLDLPDTSMVRGDRLEIFTPAVLNPSSNVFTMTLPGDRA